MLGVKFPFVETVNPNIQWFDSRDEERKKMVSGFQAELQIKTQVGLPPFQSLLRLLCACESPRGILAICGFSVIQHSGG
jgi:hypothetical protein